ncbi:MAG TPA: phenylalanine--tRNA ligase subunit beta [Mycobacteriales bacterium]|nr:phenylalanine--tRNA ligase subunit beta [Mycobacteriales bacterium]
MRVPLSWLRSLVPGLTAGVEQVAEALVRAGLEVELVHRYGHDVEGVVVGRVLDVEELTGHKKRIRYCHVDVGARVHEVVCGAINFVPGDLVPFARPGALLPGGFRIAARQTYGRVSDGMICSEAELGLADDSAGILVLPPDSPVGTDVVELLGLRDEVLDIAVTPDRGYALSVRGVAREVATAFDLPLHDPGLLAAPTTSGGHTVTLPDPGCDRYVARTVEGLDPSAPSPAWLTRRLTLAGMRPISLAVDVTNHVMLELGQPLHAFDLDALQGSVVVRRAVAGERLTTLDGQDRALDPDDLLITDDRGPIALAGVMGGAETEVSAATTRVLLESAHFAPSSITRTARRHRLPSEASKRFERGVDPDLAAAAAEAAVRLLVELGGATSGPGTDVDQRVPRGPIALPVAHPGRVAGVEYPRETVVRRLEQVGCVIAGEEPLQVTPPSWRPDLTGPAELVEEVIRLEGYDTVPVVLPVAPAGRGLTPAQRLRRTAGRALAASGLVEVVTPPFVSPHALEVLGQGHHEAPALQNPLSEEEGLLRPSLLPGLLQALQRNVGRGLHDVALYEAGSVFRGRGSPAADVPGTDVRPTADQLAALDAALPLQPRLAGLVLAGRRRGRPVEVGDAVEALLALAGSMGLELTVATGDVAPYHPGRCARLLLDGTEVGTAGELHPRVVASLDLPPRAVAAEVDLDALVTAAVAAGPARAPHVSPYPPSSVDVALVVAEQVLAADVQRTLARSAGELLEHLALFDVFTGPQVGPGRKSLAYTLRFRAPDRTLTDAEVLAARDGAVAAAAQEHGAVLRGA